MATPTWSAARSGLLGDTGAVDASGQVNQFLGTHGVTPIYRGAQILAPVGTGGGPWAYSLSAQDISQPFTMSGTTIGRVAVPLLAVGNGADLIVSLYTNSAGVPGTLLNQTRIPANWATSLSAVSGVSGPSSSLPTIQATGAPLALPQFNSWWFGAWTQNVPWTAPSVGSSALFPNTFAFDTTNGYLITVGGTNSLGSIIPYVFSFAYDGATGLNLGVAQPSLPVGLFSASAALTADTLIVLAGDTTGTSNVATVYTASWDGSTGTVGAWSQQANLPQGFDSNTSGAATWTDANGNQYVYTVGGDTGVSDTANVYWASMQNGQINSWNTASNPYPTAMAFATAFAAEGFLFVTGGTPSAGGVLSSTYFSPLGSNGAPGAWFPGPPSPVPTSAQGVAAGDALAIIGGYTNPLVSPTNDIQLFSVGATGPGLWTDQQYNGSLPNPSISETFYTMFSAGTGQLQLFFTTQSSYSTATVYQTPMISVPLPTTGLTNGTTYHLILSQAAGTSNDYLRLHQDINSFPGTPTLLTRAAGSSSWVAGPSHWDIPLAIYDNSTTGPLWHFWEDSGAKVSTAVWATTPNQALLGYLEATAQSGPVLNQAPTFANGLGQWHATGGALTQSASFTHGNLPFSAKLVPTGTDVLSFIESDLVAVSQGHQYLATAWLYSPPGYSNVAVSINWFDSTRTFLSTTSGAVNALAANTWTQFQTTVTNNVANATFLDIVLVQGGTPPASAALYASAATVRDTSGPMPSTVVEVEYGGLWPSSSAWPPLGAVEVA